MTGEIVELFVLRAGDRRTVMSEGVREEISTTRCPRARERFHDPNAHPSCRSWRRRPRGSVAGAAG